MSSRDRSSAGRSEVVPYVEGEDAVDRHTRRLNTNLNFEDAVRVEAAIRNLAVRILNDGHHWMFTHDGFLAEWWPSSAKLVFNKKWKQGIHVHDYKQLFEQIDRRKGKAS